VVREAGRIQFTDRFAVSPLPEITVTTTKSLCQTCMHVREIISGKGSRFLLCQLSQTDARFRKYPPQPIIRCEGYEKAGRDK